MNIYLIAIGGTGMAPLACLLQEAGHRVRGSDGPLYPPMSELLAAAGIEPLTGFDPAHLEPPPDLVVVGNAVPRDNPEALEVERRGLERISMPQALARFFLRGRRPLVVAGTHGKTTTTSLAAWVYTACGRDPGFLIGGVPHGLETSFRRGTGERFLVEGDEYNAAYFDRGPKFLHYRAETLILTGVEYDHADLYPDEAALCVAYRRLVEQLPAGGRLVACGDDPRLREISGAAACPVTFYGIGPGNPLRPLGGVDSGPGGSRFAVADAEAGEVEIALPLAGEHNAANALAVWAAGRADGLPAAALAAALAAFPGVRRRQELLGEAGGVVVIDDFAHHPTAVGSTLDALARRFPGRRLVAVYEPRSLTAGRAFLFDAYVDSFAAAGRVHLAPVFHAGRLAEGERLDLEALAAALEARGIEARPAADLDALYDQVLGAAAAGDVLVVMSSGSFGDLPRRLLAGLQAGEG